MQQDSLRLGYDLQVSALAWTGPVAVCTPQLRYKAQQAERGLARSSMGRVQVRLTAVRYGIVTLQCQPDACSHAIWLRADIH